MEGISNLEKKVGVVFNSLKKNFEYFEILLVDNHVGWDPAVIEKVCSSYPNLRCIYLSRRCAREIFYNVILENSLGDYVVVFDPDVYSEDIIKISVSTILGGYDMVLVDSKKALSKGLLNKFVFDAVNFSLRKILNIDFRPQRTFNGAFGRSAVNSIIRVRNKKKFLKYSDYFVGLNMKIISLPINRRHKIDKIDPMAMIFSGLDVLITNSQLPLRLASLFGLSASLLSFLFLIYVLAVSLIKKRIVEGWITTSVVTGSLFLIMFLILTILSEYISRILSETKDEPLYFITKEFTSSVKRRNNKKKVNVVGK